VISIAAPCATGLSVSVSTIDINYPRFAPAKKFPIEADCTLATLYNTTLA
jgi:hypothetical protein